MAYLEGVLPSVIGNIETCRLNNSIASEFVAVRTMVTEF